MDTNNFKIQLKFFPLLLVVLLSATTISVAQNAEKGKIAGTVLDAETGNTIPGANVLVIGTGQGASTDIDGNYSISIAPGVYTLRITYISYARKVITDVQVKAGEVTTVNTSLDQETQGLGEITVTAGFNSSTEAGLLSMQRKAVSVQDGISSEQIAKLGDSDVGQAIKRVTGVTVQNGNDVFVRGLGNRYSNVELNGSQLPSTNPNQKEAPIDLFGSGLVSNIVVQKTYTADQSAEFSGGSVQITTREFPEERNVSISYKTSYNTVSTFDNTLSSPGSSTDFLGYDNGKRSLPGILNTQRVTSDIASNVVQGLHNDWNTNRNQPAIPSQSVSIDYANQFNEDKMPIGVVSNFSYQYERVLQPDKVQRSILSFSDTGPLFYSNYDHDEGIETAELSGMMNIFTKPSPLTKIGLKTLYSNSTTNSHSILQGPYQNGTTRITVFDFDRRTIFSSTFDVETYFENFMASTLSGSFTYSLAMRERPDRRTTRYNQVGDTYSFAQFGDNNGHFFSDQEDNNYTGKIKFEFEPVDFVEIETGANAVIKDRRFTARRLAYRDQVAPFLDESVSTQPPGTVLNDQQVINNVLELVELTQFASETDFQADWYDGYQSIYASFISTQWNVFDRLSFKLGGRIEQSIQTVDVPLGIDADYVEASRLDNTDFLPAVNATYEISEESNIRAAFSRTLARPEFREISNFNFADFFGGRRVYGNPELKRTRITNYDLRFETYPSGGELFAISAFYKYFENPIGLFYRFTENNEVIYKNAKSANLYGIEIEARKDITERLQITANASYIYSETTTEEEDVNRVADPNRPMVGQSPYTFNAAAFYALSSWNMDVSMSYNTFGERIVTVGKSAQNGDEYEQSFHDLGAKINYYGLGNIDLSLEISNLLNDTRVFEQSSVTTYKYAPGVTFELGIKLSL